LGLKLIFAMFKLQATGMQAESNDTTLEITACTQLPDRDRAY
jgi:hypothetical protein